MAYNPTPTNLISTANSTTSVLGAAGVFTGTSEDVTNYSLIQVSVYSSHASATDGLSIQQSSDGTNWDIVDTYTILAATGKTFSFQPSARYFRIVYTNGGTLQTSFRLQTIYHVYASKSSSQRPSDALSNETDTEQISALVHVYNGATWDRLRGDVTNGLYVAGGVAHDGIDSGNPLKIGGKATTGNTTPVADADRVNAWFDEFGRQVVSNRDPETGMSSTVTSLRDSVVAQRYTVLADSIADGLATFWTSTVANGGTSTSTGGEGLIQTSANASGSAQLVSPAVSYFPGQVTWFNSAIRLGDTGSAGNVRRWGVFTVSGTTPQEGFYYELNGTTLNAVVVKGGSATATASTSWSRVIPAPFTLDTNYHSFEIRWTANSVLFFVDNVVRHIVSGTNTPITTTLNFPIAFQSINSSGATNRVLAVRNCGIGRFGHPETPATTGGFVSFHLSSAATTNATVIKSSPGQVFGWYIYNSNASARKVTFHNTATTPTAGANVFYTLVIPGSSGANILNPIGIEFSTGIAITTTTGLADNDTAAVAANELNINIFYK